MCGIVGNIGKKADISLAVESIHHRGPDSRGIESFEIDETRIQLGHTRLAILDLTAAGHQPMWSRDHRWCITFNGEIYNHLEIRSDLEGPFRGHSDTETLVEALAKFGIDAVLNKLNGIFAFGAIDTLGKKFYLVRDRFGVKCTYYTTNGPGVAFASEVRALKAMGVASNQLDSIALESLLTLRFVPSPETLWRDVRRLGPGEILEFDLATQRRTISRYIRPTSEKFYGSADDATRTYRSLLSDAVDRQMLSDVPIGIFLSGGIDSALLAAMAKNNGHAVSTYTVGFGAYAPECEIAAAAHTAKTLNLDHKVITVSAEDLRSTFVRTITQIEEPLGTTSVLPMWYLCQLARKDVKVVLSGQGSDEPWGGYRRYQLEILRSMIPIAAFWQVANLFAQGKLGLRLPEFARKALRAAPIKNRAERYAASYELFPAVDRELLIGTKSSGHVVETIQYWLDWLQDSSSDKNEQMLRIDTRMNLSDDLLLYTDKISMAFALETRVPMLDNEIVSFVESLPLHYRATLAKTKIVHRLLASTYLPKEIVNRPKLGFQVPFGDWLRTDWREWTESLLLNKNGQLANVIDLDGLKILWTQHLKKKTNRSTQLFTLLALSVWLENCL